MNPLDRERLRKQLIIDEGKRLRLYKDTKGKWTIGIGRNLSDRGISSDEADYLLDNDITTHWNELIKALPWVLEMNSVRQRVVLNMAFNMGIPSLLGFKNTLRAMREQRWADAKRGMLASKWHNDVGERAKRLATLMEKGVE